MIIPWAKVILAALQIAEIVMTWLRNKELLDAGADREIARASASILVKTQAGREIVAQVTAMTPEEVDAALKALEPK